MSWQGFNDPMSQAVFAAFKQALEPTIAQVAPGWDLHHIRLERRDDFDTGKQEAVIQLVIRPAKANEGHQSWEETQRVGVRALLGKEKK